MLQGIKAVKVLTLKYIKPPTCTYNYMAVKWLTLLTDHPRQLPVIIINPKYTLHILMLKCFHKNVLNNSC